MKAEPKKPRALISWSSGKDSAWMLACLQRSAAYEIAGLLVSTNSHFARVAMHGTRMSVVAAQAQAVRLPLWEAPLPWPCSNQQYERIMRDVIDRAVREDISVIAFGDLFLEDIREYREQQLSGTGITPVFPLWMSGADPTQYTRQLAEEMIDGGLRAKLVCVDPKSVGGIDAALQFAGRDFDHPLLGDMPATLDRCGERGEFHTCVYAGPMFASPLLLEPGDIVEWDGFVYADFELADRGLSSASTSGERDRQSAHPDI